MVLCDFCKQHVEKRVKVEPNKVLPLVGISRETLKKMTDDDLIEVRRIASTGALVCKDCEDMCKKGVDCNLEHQRNRNIYSIRVAQDELQIKLIEDEVNRRINIIKTLLAIKKK